MFDSNRDARPRRFEFLRNLKAAVNRISMKHTGQLFRRAIVRRAIAPGLARIENLRWYARTTHWDIQSEYRVPARSSFFKAAVENGVNNRAGVRQLDSFSLRVWPARP